MERGVCGGGQKGRLQEKVRASLGHRECRLHRLVSRFMQEMQAQQPGIPIYARKKRGILRAVYRS